MFSLIIAIPILVIALSFAFWYYFKKFSKKHKLTNDQLQKVKNLAVEELLLLAGEWNLTKHAYGKLLKSRLNNEKDYLTLLKDTGTAKSELDIVNRDIYLKTAKIKAVLFHYYEKGLTITETERIAILRSKQEVSKWLDQVIARKYFLVEQDTAKQESKINPSSKKFKNPFARAKG